MSSPTTHGSGYLPADVLERAGRRLSIAALLVAGGYALMTALYLTVYAHEANTPTQVIAAIVIVVSLYIAWHVRSGRCTGHQAMHLGLAYELVVCLGLWVSDFITVAPTGVPDQVSWACIIILFFPALVPTTPRVTLFTSIVAATSGLLGYWIAQQVREIPISDPGVLSGLLVPAFMCALLAYVPARVVHSLGSAVKRARQLGSYELVEPLGEGGAGEVWRARHRLLARPAAIKLIRGEGAPSEAVKKRFEREAQITAALESPHTVELYDFGVADDGAFYYVMELLRGIDLEQLVRRFGPLPPARVVHLLQQACDSLDDAHLKGLVHRDIKPANLYLCKRSRRCDFVKVLDFGLVQVEEPAPDTRQTADGIILGTPAYLAPETVTGEQEVAASADIYSLGCVAYYLLTARLVFDEDTPMKAAIAHATAAPVPPSERCDQAIPPSLERIVMACLEKEPSARPASALELAMQLEACELDSWSAKEASAWWDEHLADVMTEKIGEVVRSDQPTALLRPAP